MPFGGEFSPNQIDLEWVLQACAAAHSNAEAIEAIRAQYFADSAPRYVGKARHEQQSKRANNVLIGLRDHGILAPGSITFTDLGKELLALSLTRDLGQLFARVAQNILTNLHGMELLEAVQTIQRRGETPTKKSISEELRRRGFDVPVASTKHQIALLWLAKAGAVQLRPPSINEQRVKEILGADVTLDDLAKLSQRERLFLQGLARLTDTSGAWISASDVIKYAQDVLGLRVAEDRWQAVLIQPLSEKGWIDTKRGTTGRGAKSGQVRGTSRFQSEYVQQLLTEEAAAIPADLRTRLDRPIDQIFADLHSPNTHTKGVALELLSLRLMQLLNLRFRSFRLRARSSGYAEVDLIVEGVNLLFSRWQIQCKNTKQVDLHDLAKEVGLAFMLRSHVVMLVTTGTFTNDVTTHQQLVNQTSALQVVLINGQALKRIVAAGSSAGLSLATALVEQAERALIHKAAQVIETED